LSEKHESFLRLWKNKDFQEERMTKVGLYTSGESTTLESNKSPLQIPRDAMPARLSSFRLLAMTSPHLDARRKLLI
jgi:hypothetical protein